MQVPIARTVHVRPYSRPAVARFDRKYTPSQRAAVSRAAVDDKIPPREIRRRAGAGELYGLEPFDIPISTIYSYKKRDVRRRAATPKGLQGADGATAADDLRRRVLVLADGMMLDAERQRTQGKLTAKDFETTSAAVLRIATELEQKLQSGEARKGPLHDRPGDFLEQLATTETVPDTNGNGNGSSEAAQRSTEHTTQ